MTLPRSVADVLSDPDPPTPPPLRAAAHAWDKAIDQLTQQAGIAA